MENQQKRNYDHWYELANTVNLDALTALAKTLRENVADSEDLINATLAVINGTIEAMWKGLGITPEIKNILSILAYRRINELGDGFTSIMNYDDMLDPANRNKFEKVMSESVFNDIQAKAVDRLGQEERGEIELHPAVKYHLESIAKGRVPFGYELIEDMYKSVEANYVRVDEQQAEAEAEAQEVEEYIPAQHHPDECTCDVCLGTACCEEDEPMSDEERAEMQAYLDYIQQMQEAQIIEEDNYEDLIND